MRIASRVRVSDCGVEAGEIDDAGERTEVRELVVLAELAQQLEKRRVGL